MIGADAARSRRLVSIVLIFASDAGWLSRVLNPDVSPIFKQSADEQGPTPGMDYEFSLWPYGRGASAPLIGLPHCLIA